MSINRKALRKLVKQQKVTSSKPKKALTPDSLQVRFNHMIKNTSDAAAIERYAEQVSQAIKHKAGQVMAQFMLVIEKQTQEVLQQAKDQNSASLQRLHSQLCAVLSAAKKQHAS
tara:strand:+ start:205616 stop:205957 length:342 start_codon:yes stop_codon:yes gene_type:complete